MSTVSFGLTCSAEELGQAQKKPSRTSRKGQIVKNSRFDQVSNELPQPQDCLALGFLILNPAPFKSSW